MGKGKTVMIARTAAGSAEGPSSRRLYRKNKNKKKQIQRQHKQETVVANLPLCPVQNQIEYAINHRRK